MAEHDGPTVGGVGAEAAKLFAALQDWARDNGSDYAGATASAAAGAASAFQQVNEHLATGGQDCRYCPVCQVISAVRSTSPEVRAHLRTAATSLLEAAAGMLATAVPDDTHSARDAGVEKIDLNDDLDDDWEED